MSTIENNLLSVQKRIRLALEASARPLNSLTLMAVSKKHPVTAIEKAYQLGIRHFGENQIQEAIPKIQAFSPTDIHWHFIGPIQSNKTTKIAAHFDWVHSVCRADTLNRLSRQRPDNLDALNICLQINISEEPNKSGASLSEVRSLAELSHSLPNIRLRGLMCIPKRSDNFQEQCEAFRQLASAFESIQPISKTIDTLSMGMSADLEAAVSEGATIVRIGSAIFGHRTTL